MKKNNKGMTIMAALTLLVISIGALAVVSADTLQDESAGHMMEECEQMHAGMRGNKNMDEMHRMMGGRGVNKHQNHHQ